jgi:AAA family ATP:ADP antiporter
MMRRLGLEPREGRLLALMGLLVGILLCAYTIAKVLRDALFLQEFGALSLPYAYIGVAFASAGYVWLDSALARRLTHVGSSRFNQYAAIVLSILAAVALPISRHWTAGLFYLWTGSQAMMLIPNFWALALDLWDSRRARRLFPLLTGCGLVGGLAGGAIAAGALPIVHHVGLMWIVSGLLVVALALTASIDRHRSNSRDTTAAVSNLSSWEIIRQSGYIKILTVGLALSVIVGTLVDFEFKLLVQRMYPEPHHLTRFLGAFYMGLNGVSLLFQFGPAGWLLQRLGLGAATALQPGAVLVLAAWAAMTTGGWVVVAMRWVQGVVSQTLGKSSTEIYYAAIDPKERRRIKSAIDTLIERWSDALVGVVLIVVLHLLRVPVAAITIATGALAALWLAVLFFQNRQYGLAFHEALSRRWIGPDEAPESMRLPSSRHALRAALASEDERQVLVALELSEHASDAETSRAVRASLRHASPRVRAAAVDAMTAMRLPDPEHVIEGFLGDPHDGLRRAAVGYLLSRREQPIDFARRVLDGDEPALKEHLLDALLDHPQEARRLLGWEWIDSRLASGTREDLLLAARALGAMDGEATAQRLKTLLTNSDVEIQRVALRSAARRPSGELLDVLLPLLASSELSYEAGEAVAAVGEPAVPELARVLGGEHDGRAQRRAARTLAKIASPRAVEFLKSLARSGDARLRYLGLNGMARVRIRTGRPVLRRRTAHRFFLRELRDYRVSIEPSASLETSDAAEVRLLGESYRESADRALERALTALACWYDPKPLAGVYDRLRSRDLAVASPALEYLGHVLPRSMFGPVSRIFEKEAMATPDGAPEIDRLAQWIGMAWDTGDAWLRACAVRASRFAPAFDRGRFANGDGGDPIVRAELDALSGNERTATESRSC